MISCIIPVRAVSLYKDEKYLELCLASVEKARSFCEEEIEILIVRDSTGKMKSCNKVALKAKGETLVFLDGDCQVSREFFDEVSRKAKNPYFAGGGVKWVYLERLSLGIFCWVLYLLSFLLLFRITAGAFWVRREVWFELEGFRDKYKYYDLDFAVRLKRYAKRHGRKFESLKESTLIWSTRKFDIFGDWHWLLGYKVE